MKVTSIYGKALAFPYRLDQDGARPLVVGEEEAVKSSMAVLLSTRKGERPHLVRAGKLYGVSNPDPLFENADGAADIIRMETREALEVWEPRIVVRDVICEREKIGPRSKIRTTIKFTYRATNRDDNFVVPFRTTEPASR